MNLKKTKLPGLVSYLFHPLFMPTFGLAYFYLSKKISGFNLYTSASIQADNHIIIVSTVIFTLFIPLITVFVLKKANYISSYHMPKKEERLLPFSLMSLSMFCLNYLLFNYFNVNADLIIKAFYFGCLLSIVFALFITLKWKISIHMIGLGGFTGAVFLLTYLSNSDNLIELSIAFMLSGLVGYSRLHLGAHSLKQVAAGFLLGFASETILLYII